VTPACTRRILLPESCFSYLLLPVCILVDMWVLWTLPMCRSWESPSLPWAPSFGCGRNKPASLVPVLYALAASIVTLPFFLK